MKFCQMNEILSKYYILMNALFEREDKYIILLWLAEHFCSDICSEEGFWKLELFVGENFEPKKLSGNDYHYFSKYINISFLHPSMWVYNCTTRPEYKKEDFLWSTAPFTSKFPERNVVFRISFKTSSSSLPLGVSVILCKTPMWHDFFFPMFPNHA